MTASLISQFLPVLSERYLVDENILVPELLARCDTLQPHQAAAERLATQIVEGIRAQKPRSMDINQLLVAYQLTSEEGIALMCVAEALLRIPDTQTRNALIRDKMSVTEWEASSAANPFQNFSTWALNLTGNVLHLQNKDSGWGVFGKLIARLGQPVIRTALEQAMRLMGNQFVLGETIDEAIANRRKHPYPHATASYDMLGEGARTINDAARYFQAYETAIHAVGKAKMGDSISIKLSALHPRYEWRKPDRIRHELFHSVFKLCAIAKAYDLMVTIDAEEMDRLVPSLELFEMLARTPELSGWNGLGLAVQAYGKRCTQALEFVIALARDTRRIIPTRLVKGAYWDSEIKRAQVEGHENYPVFTRKSTTDVSYLAGAQLMLSAPDAIYPQFATHNAMTAAMIMQIVGDKKYEFQRLHGMGDNLYESLSAVLGRPVPYRIYAPVGPHHDLLAYLVRRLLENGANSSFVYQIADKNIPVKKMLDNPVQFTANLSDKLHPKISLPPDIFGAERKNSFGPLLPEPMMRDKLIKDIQKFLLQPYEAAPIIDGKSLTGVRQTKYDPSDNRRALGTSIDCTTDDVARAMEVAHHTQHEWDKMGGAARGKILARAADLFEFHMPQLVALIVREGGRTLQSAINDFREAVDFLRYYGAQAAREFETPVRLPGPTGEQNELWLRGRGVFVCIAPWNFPLAIFTGQATAALAAGNSVIAKPAGQTPMVAHYAVKLLHQAGVPTGVLHFTPGSGSALGKVFVESKYT
ncbi:MAG TPA: bifunctional proline dehydrogenase/L-glutamate gamma-semialdehyde dehydrogenase PutA, partial [Rhodospirillaceae bacterium]|nr:bifunctional proline dehydrogenase/L-glutamate gamma-semialdehyde dehydrogenase PutA [Rhodospirillaceae bacterium]